MYTLDVTAAAEGDLDRITDYIGERLANPPAALALLDEIESVSDGIRTDPALFPLCVDPRLAKLGYRKAVVRSYVMVYEIDEAAEAVRVLRVFHSSEDYQRKL